MDQQQRGEFDALDDDKSKVHFVQTLIADRLDLKPPEREMFYGMNKRERSVFDSQPDNNSKVVFIQAFVEKEKSWKEKSVCLVESHILFILLDILLKLF